ncbi:hypothetical protein ABT237_25360 [Streptomyces sp. NPDC001581]|uniref:hypothetical protein n=1 Tax=Streptomyces sp. NPDC001581 TaxID=3154386 RepID=UPI0033329A28
MSFTLAHVALWLLPPDVPSAIVREGIEARCDMTVLQQLIGQEPAERQAIIDRLNGLR